MLWLWGKTGYSFFDVSFLVHFAFWFFAGSVPWYFKANRWVSMLACVGIAFVWEVAEHFLAKRFPAVWKNPESWWNAWVSDPLVACPLGVLLVWLALDRWTSVQ